MTVTGQPRPTAPSSAGQPSSPPARRSTADRQYPVDNLRFTALADPVLDRLGHDPRSPYVERFWLPILGPSCILLLRRLAADLERSPDGFTLDTPQLAAEMGLGMKGGRNGPLWRAVERACRFGSAQRNGDLVAVRRRLPPLTARQIDRLPPHLQQAHQSWVEDRQRNARRPTVSRWSEGRTAIDPPSPGLLAGSEKLEDAA